MLDWYKALFTGMGEASTLSGIVSIYGKILVKLYAIVTEGLIIIEAS